MIVKVFGGLGNQMFQYSFARALSEIYQSEVWLDYSEFGKGSFITERTVMLNTFNVTLPIANKTVYENHSFNPQADTINRLYRFIAKKSSGFGKNWIVERDFAFNKAYQKNSNYYEGYWQSYKYFDQFRDILVKEFTLKSDAGIDKNLANKIIIQESVSVHIRRGDYANNPKVMSHHGLLTQDYYNSAIEYIKQQRPNAAFFVFSDEIDWVEKNMFHGVNAYFVKNFTAECELYLMSLCKHNIIANSTFSWWSAYLNTNHNKIVIAPVNWFNNITNTNDLIPETWIRI